MQGLFVPGVIVVIIAYIGEEFAGGNVGKVMSSYISGTVWEDSWDAMFPGS